jgi:2-oxoglutarate ferredoxin oxidoreductase subunit beta
MITQQAPAAEGRTIYRRPRLLTNPTSYCPGCGHGIVHRLLAEVLEELEIGERTVLVGSVGCSVFAYDYLRLDAVESPHGRAAAVATGVKRCRPDRVVLTYQGDGDLAAIGTAEITHAAARGERFTTIFVNNGIYGMTGGQMAPTTLPGQRTTSSPTGRDTSVAGYPLPVTELLSLLPGVQYAARVSVGDPGMVGKAKQAIKRAFEVQLEGRGFSIVEVLSTCPVGWGLTPSEAMARLRDVVMPAYPVGTFVDRAKGISQALPAPAGTGPAGGCAAAAPRRPPAKRAMGRLEE